MFGEFQVTEKTRKRFEDIRAQLSLEASIDLCGFFASALVVSIAVSYGQKFSLYRTISILLILGFFCQEAYWVGSADDDDEEDIE